MIHASSAVFLRVVVRIDRTDLDAAHRGVIGKGILRPRRTHCHALPRRIIAVGVLLHGTDLHAQPSAVIREVHIGAT